MRILRDDELARIPAQPPRRADLLPGLRFSRAASPRMLALPLAFLALMAVMPLAVLAGDRNLQLALRETETAEGRVETVEAGRACQGESSEISFSFPSRAGVVFRGAESVCPRSPYQAVRPGDSVPVVYLVSDPAVNALAGETAAGGAASLLPILLFPLFGLVFFAPLFWPRVAQLRRDRKLFTRGTLATGRVVFVATQRDSFWPGWPAPTRGEVFVAAELPAGGEQEVKAVCNNDWLLAHLAPGAEVHVCVVGGNAVLLENYVR